jgi:hypothetical protein
MLHQLSEIRLEYSFMAVAAFLRMAIEHLHDRFLVPNLILVQQARLCNTHIGGETRLRALVRLKASSAASHKRGPQLQSPSH